MSKTNVFIDYVNELSAEDFKQLKDACDKRIDKELYGVTTFEEAALEYGRTPICPKCGSNNYCLDGKTNANHNRYLCLDCNSTYTLLSNSIFNSSKISFHKLMNYINLISFNVPHELIAEILDIGLNTTDLWRKKIFETVNGYQEHLKLYNQIFIDETYIEDYEVLAIKDTGKHLRGLSRSKICIVVAIDSYKNIVAIVSGHGKPSSKMIITAL